LFSSIFLNNDGTLTQISTEGFVASLLSAIIIGFLISLVYVYTHKKEGYAQGYVWTMIMLPPIVAVIITLISNNIAGALSLAGAFTLVRFRSAPGDPKEIAHVFLATAAGLACGLGYIAYAFLFFIILTTIMIILHKTRYAASQTKSMTLKITIPENLNYIGMFDNVLNKYTSTWILKRVKTTEFGSLFELIFSLEVKNTANQKEFIDELRTLNGNLNIILSLYKYDDKIYQQ
jgi:hypothetical protein